MILSEKNWWATNVYTIIDCSIQKQSFPDVSRNRCSKNFAKFTGSVDLAATHESLKSVQFTQKLL